MAIDNPSSKNEAIENIDKMYDILQKALAKSNQIPLSEFRKYESLFRHNDKKEFTQEEESNIHTLSTELFKRIDPYSPIDIIYNNQVVLTLPPIFVPFKSIDPKYKEAVDVNRNMLSQDIAKYKYEAYDRMITLLMKTQLDDENIANLRKAKADFDRISNIAHRKLRGEKVDHLSHLEEDDDTEGISFDEWEE